MAGGQQINTGQGSVTYAKDEAVSGSEATAAQGSHGVGQLVRLHSRKVGGGAAVFALSGLAQSSSSGVLVPVPQLALSGGALTTAAGSFGKTRSRALAGSATTFGSGLLTASGGTGGPSTGPNDADWQQRSTAEGVLRAFDFNDSSSLGPTYLGTTNGTPNRLFPHWHQGPVLAGESTHQPDMLPRISTAKKRSGTAAMCMPIKSLFYGQSTKWRAWFGNTSQDEVLIGENEEIWVQYAVLWTPAIAEVIRRYPALKFGGIGTGGLETSASVAENWLGMVWAHVEADGAPIIYANEHTMSPAGGIRDSGDFKLIVPGGGDVYQQNGIVPVHGVNACVNSNVRNGIMTGCGLMPYETWVTFTVQFKLLGRRTTAPYTNNPNQSYIDFEYRHWMYIPGQMPMMLHDWHAGVGSQYEPMSAGPPSRGDGLGFIELTVFLTTKGSGSEVNRRPMSTVSASNFAGSNQHLLIDDQWKPTDAEYDADYTYSLDNTTGTLEVLLDGGEHGQFYDTRLDIPFNSNGSTTFRYRAAKTANGVLDNTGGAVTCQAQILEGTTLRATGTLRTLTGTFQNFDDSMFLGAVSNWSNLRAKFTITGTTGRGGAISLVNLGGAHPEPAEQWYDEVIISSQRIRHPYPAWRSGKEVGQVYTIPNTAFMGDPAKTTFSELVQDGAIRAYTGHALDEKGRWFVVSGGGHAQNCVAGYFNGILKFNFWADAPGWEWVDQGSTLANTTINRFNLDGRAAGRHTYDKGVYIGHGKMPDGKERLGQCTAYATYAFEAASNPCGKPDDGTGHWPYGPDFQTFRLNQADWFAHTTFNGAVHGWDLRNSSRDCPAFNNASVASSGASEALIGICQDPATHDIYAGGPGPTGTRSLYKWTAATDTWSGPLVTQATASAYRVGNGSPTLFDRNRNRIVSLWAAEQTDGVSDGPMRLVCTQASSPHTVTTISVTPGVITWPNVRSRMVHDLDNDRYLIILVQHNNTGDDPYALWAINPTTGAMTQASATIPSGNGMALNNNGGLHLGFIPDLHCVVWQAGHEKSPIYFMPTK